MLNIIEYSKKAFVVRGDTEPHKDSLLNRRGKWNPNLKGGAGWIFSNRHIENMKIFVDEVNNGWRLTPVLRKPSEMVVRARAKAMAWDRVKTRANTRIEAKALAKAKAKIPDIKIPDIKIPDIKIPEKIPTVMDKNILKRERYAHKNIAPPTKKHKRYETTRDHKLRELRELRKRINKELELELKLEANEHIQTEYPGEYSFGSGNGHYPKYSGFGGGYQSSFSRVVVNDTITKPCVYPSMCCIFALIIMLVTFITAFQLDYFPVEVTDWTLSKLERVHAINIVNRTLTSIRSLFNV
jgi:hypothetical protein